MVNKYKKIMLVIDSCKSIEQIDNAKRYIKLFEKLYIGCESLTLKRLIKRKVESLKLSTSHNKSIA